MKSIFNPLFVILLLCYFHIEIQAQQSAVQHRGSFWLKYDSSTAPTEKDVINKIMMKFSLNNRDQLLLREQETDKLGMRHDKYIQTHDGIPIEGAEVLLHFQNDKPYLANGMLVGNISASSSPVLDQKTAVYKARSHMPASVYAWQSDAMENLLKKATSNPMASFYPEPELIYVDADFCNDPTHYQLAYKLDIYSFIPSDAKRIYIDARKGNVMLELPILLSTDVPGQAQTKYSGLQNIITDSVAPDTFLLIDESRGGGIETRNLHNTTNMNNATNFYDEDNYWNNVNAFQDEAATDAHWALEMTYDYYLQKQNRNSYDNNGSRLIANEHYKTLLGNAFWNGSWASFGDGNNNYSTLTSVDVIAHELTHGVTSKSAALIYLNESGALNESFSDIFGASVEYYAVPDSFDWYVGEDFDMVNHTGFRNMAEPNSKADPDTYKGQYWYLGSMDNGGVHTNSGVMNYWYYLLTTGGSGTNDNGDQYSVSSLGIDTAASIAYRNLTVYLTETSKYWDARMGALQAAEDLYGACSNAVLQTANAWYAVGLGYPVSDDDINLIRIAAPGTDCNLGNSEQLTITFRYNGCGSPLLAGDSIPFAFIADSQQVVRDTLVLTSQLNGGDSLTYTLPELIDFSALGTHTIKCWSEMPGDSIHFNDSITSYSFQNLLQQNFDLGVVNFLTPLSFCNLGSSETLAVDILFNGCDSLPASSQFNCSYRVNGGNIFTDTITLANTLYNGNTLNHVFSTTFDASAKGKYLIKAWTDYNPDTLRANDSLMLMVTNPEVMSTDTISFEDSLGVLDTTILLLKPYASAFVSQQAANTGNFGFRMTGDDVSSILPELLFLDTAVWDINPGFDAKLCFCVDAANWATARLRFDLKQNYAATHKLVNGVLHSQRASSLRVLADGVQMSKTYHPKTYINDTFVTRTVNFDAFAGSSFQLCFEAKNYMSEDFEIVPWGKGDNAFLDNIYFNWTPAGIKEQMNEEDVLLYPNPCDGILFAQTFVKENSTFVIEVYDILGKKVLYDERQTNSGLNTFRIDLDDKIHGHALVKILLNGQIHSSVIIVDTVN